MNENHIMLEVSEDEAKELLDSLDGKSDRINNVLNSFRSNQLSHTKAYEELKVVQMEVDERREELENEIDKQTEEKNEGLAELFS